MGFDALGSLHLLAAGAALALGTAVAVSPKGTATHRAIGHSYLGAMVALNLTALLIYDLSGRWNLFHFAALVSLATILLGWRAARRRRPGWRLAHGTWMLWNYVGLLCATTSELVVRVPGLVRGPASFGIAIGVASMLTAAVGGFLIHRAVARIPPGPPRA